MRRFRGLNRIKTATLKDRFAEGVKTRWIRWFILVLIPYSLLLTPSCDDTSFQSSVPRYPVHVVIDTNSGPYVHFQPTALNTYVLVDKEGYHYNGITYRRPVTDAYGYGGVVVFVNMLGGYDAYDLACPNCVAKAQKSPCEIDGIFATCPNCGEQYDLGSGTAAPQKGIAHEYLLRLTVINSGGRLTIKQ